MNALQPVLSFSLLAWQLGYDTTSLSCCLVLPPAEMQELDVLPARDRLLRRTRFLVFMETMVGRADTHDQDAPFGAYTSHLPLPDGNIDLPVRRRVHQVDLEAGAGHEDMAPKPDAESERRGPGAYPGALLHGAVGTEGPFWDFSRAQGRLEEQLVLIQDGDRLVLEPGIDAIRPTVPSAIIFPEHAEPSSKALPYQTAAYDFDMDVVSIGCGQQLTRL